MVSGLSGTNGVNIEGGAKPYSANFGTKSDGRGNIHSINTKLKENALLGVGPSYNTNIQGVNNTCMCK